MYTLKEGSIVMWTISQLKARGKAAFKKNYWRALLVALVLSIIGGSSGSGVSGGLFSGVGNKLSNSNSNSSSNSANRRYEDEDDRDNWDDYLEEYGIDDDDFDDLWGEFDDGEYDYHYHYEYDDSDNSNAGVVAAIMAGAFAIIVVVVMIVCVIALLLRIFLFNPIEVGGARFFVKNLTENGEVRELGYAFDGAYKNHVSIMFMRTLFIFLWSLLCVIPGIYKKYEYRMIPYLLAEYPNLTRDQAFSISKQMMYGYKMKAFLLDLSFIGWWILNVFTCGLLGVFFVEPYYQSTAAAFYEALKGYNGIPGIAAPMWGAPQPQTNYGQPQGTFGQMQQAGFDNGVKPAAIDPEPAETPAADVSAVEAVAAGAEVNEAAVVETAENTAAVDPIANEASADEIS